MDDCTRAVYSEEYYDLIVKYDDIRENTQLGPCIQDINSQYTISYRRKILWPPYGIRYYTYTAVPKLYSVLDARAMEAANILQIQNQPTLSLKGQGVLIGFVDTGIDYENPLFRNADGTSRIAAIWDQNITEGPPPAGFIYGAEYRNQQINQALMSQEPFGVVPSQDTQGHGTYVASLAAGGINIANSFNGAAPYAQIAMVKLKGAKNYLREYFFVADDALAFQENDIMAGLAYLDRLAYELNMPLVICFALGTNLGSHGGTSSISNVLDDIVGRRRRAAVVAAGNEANNRHHYLGTIQENGSYENVEVNVGNNVSGFVLELWAPAYEIFSLEIISPTGERIPRQNTQTKTYDYFFIFENTRVSIDKSITFTDNNLQVIFLRFETPSQGIWNIRVFAEDVIAGTFEMWLPMEQLIDGEIFFLRSNPDTTITVPGSTRLPITVGGYNAGNDSIYLDSGRGYTLTGEVKPDLVAPAVEVIGAGLRNNFVARSGTSASAAITAGAVALFLEWAVVRENYPRLTATDLRVILIRGAQRDAQRMYPNREWGYGRLDLYEAFSNLRTT